MVKRKSKAWFSLMFDTKCYIQHPPKPRQYNSVQPHCRTYCSRHHMVIRESKTWFSLVFDTKCYIQHPPKPQQHNSVEPHCRIYCSWHHMVIRESKAWFSLMFDTKCYIQPSLKPPSHMYCNLSATALRLKNSCNQCNHCVIKNCIFRLQINRRQLSLKIGDRSATGGQLIANWLEMGCDWSATRWRLVGDRSAMSWRLTIEQTICCVGVIMNKALINCYSMAISISIMSYCLFFGYFLAIHRLRPCI